MTVIAEALAKRKDLITEARELQALVVANAVRYEDDDESEQEDPKELLERFRTATDEAQSLTVKINKVNNATTFKFDGATYSLMEAIAYRERLLSDQRAFKAIAEGVASPYRGYGARSKDDVKQVVRIDVKAMRKQANDAALTVRRLDMEMQKVNWATEID